MTASHDRRAPDSSDESLWVRWAQQRELAAKNELVERHLWLARTLAIQVYRQRTSAGALELKDLIQLATVGLLEAVDRFDPARGVKFSHYASKRIRGSVLNGLEQYTEFHAQSAAAYSLARERAQSLAQKHGSRDRHNRFEELVKITVGLAIGLMLEDTAMVADENRPDFGPYACNETFMLREQLRHIVEGLPLPERTVIRYHYFNELTFSHIGGLMGVTKARISQIHAKAISRIRIRYRELGALDLKV